MTTIKTLSSHLADISSNLDMALAFLEEAFENIQDHIEPNKKAETNIKHCKSRLLSIQRILE